MTGTGVMAPVAAIDELELAVVEVEDLGGVGDHRWGVGGLVVELDGGAGGMTSASTGMV